MLDKIVSTKPTRTLAPSLHIAVLTLMLLAPFAAANYTTIGSLGLLYLAYIGTYFRLKQPVFSNRQVNALFIQLALLLTLGMFVLFSEMINIFLLRQLISLTVIGWVTVVYFKLLHMELPAKF